MKKFLVVVALGILLGNFAYPVHAQKGSGYKAIEVSNEGSIVGVAKFAGAVPEPKRLDADKDKDVCARDPIFYEALIVSKENKGIRNVVVSLTNIKKGKKVEPPKTKPQLDQRGCVFLPHVLILPAGVTLEILNNDGILHNFHTYSIKNTSVNKAQPKFKKKMKETFRAPETIKVSCDLHRWMSAWLVVTDHPYYAITDENGSFKITDVPPGTYQLQYWHEKLGKQTKEITVKAGTETRADMEYKEK